MNKFINIRRKKLLGFLAILIIFTPLKVLATSNNASLYVYTKTRAAVLENNKGQIILQLNVPSELKIVGNNNKDKLKVKVEGWVSKYDLKNVSHDILQKDPEVIGGLIWPDSLEEFRRHYQAIGEITDHTPMINTGETRTVPGDKYVVYKSSKKKSKYMKPNVYVKVLIEGWIERSYITHNKSDVQRKGQIYGLLLRGDEPAQGIRVSCAGQEKITDSTGRYRFEGLCPGKEYKVYIHIGDKRYHNIFNYPVLDPDEELDYGELDISPYEK